MFLSGEKGSITDYGIDIFKEIKNSITACSIFPGAWCCICPNYGRYLLYFNLEKCKPLCRNVDQKSYEKTTLSVIKD
ncbi:MAG: hypothetical protein EOL97_13075 [Spirochaetia bacterium]|nr:hypothetical protein [Spirochaetia bacterium]